MRRRQADHPEVVHPDVVPVDPDALLADAERKRAEAAELEAQAEQLRAERAEAQRVAAVEAAQRERQHRYLAEVDNRRQHLAQAIGLREQAVIQNDVARAERDRLGARHAQKKAERDAAWAELDRAVEEGAPGPTAAADAAMTASEKVLERCALRLAEAEAAVTRSEATVETCTDTVAACFDALVALGPEAVGDTPRPDCLPDPLEVARAAALAAAAEKDSRHAAALNDRSYQANRERAALVAAGRRQMAGRQAASAGAAWMNDVNRAARG